MKPVIINRGTNIDEIFFLSFIISFAVPSLTERPVPSGGGRGTPHAQPTETSATIRCWTTGHRSRPTVARDAVGTDTSAGRPSEGRTSRDVGKLPEAGPWTLGAPAALSLIFSNCRSVRVRPGPVRPRTSFIHPACPAFVQSNDGQPAMVRPSIL